MKTIAVASAFAALASSVALAQDASPPIPAAPSTVQLVAQISPAGILVGEKPSVAVKYVAIQAADLMASSIVGAPIYNDKEEKLGEVTDLVLTDGSNVTGVVASVGGFLGIGESYVVLDPSTVVVARKDGDWAVHVNTTKDDLTAAPKFEYAKKA